MRKIKFRGKIQSCSGQFDRHFRHKQQLGGLIEYLLLEKLFRRNIENGAATLAGKITISAPGGKKEVLRRFMTGIGRKI